MDCPKSIVANKSKWPLVDHLNEVAGAVGSAVKITKLGCTTKFFASRRSLALTLCAFAFFDCDLSTGD